MSDDGCLNCPYPRPYRDCGLCLNEYIGSRDAYERDYDDE